MHIPSGHVRSRGGFTLVELLVTISLASVLLAIAVPSFRSLTISNRLTTQANEFAAAINVARSEAIKRNSSVVLCRSTSAAATACAAASADWGFWIVRASSGTIVRNGTVNTAGALKVQSTLTNDTITFTPDGLASTGGAVVNDHVISVCTSNTTHENFRNVVLGVGSRISTNVAQGTC